MSKVKVAKKNARQAVEPIVLPVRIYLQVTWNGTDWGWVFFSASGVLLDRRGALTFERSADSVDVDMVIVDSPGVSFLASADRCVAFDKAACPTTSDKKDKDVFKHLRVNKQLDTLSFTNKNTKGVFYYALFANADGQEIFHDPIIINKSN